MSPRALIVGHADPDGHVIVEQCRRNLSRVGFAVQTLVDPERTQNHKVWTRLDELREIDDHRLVFFVDLMFAPKSFALEADGLLAFVHDRPDTKFFVLDHHPLPRNQLQRAPNLRTVYRDDVLDCAIGPTPLMQYAALCEKQPTRALKSEANRHVVEGLKRVGSLGSPLAGKKLLALLAGNAWADIAALGKEASSNHRRPRGRYSESNEETPAMHQLIARANTLAADAGRAGAGESIPEERMVYDFDDSAADAPHRDLHSKERPPSKPKPFRRDLEDITTLLELGAILLTDEEDREFTLDELLSAARGFAEPGYELVPKDVDLVLGKLGLLKKVGSKYRLK